jgi:hypothetical protein
MTVGTALILIIILFFYFLFMWCFRLLFFVLITKMIASQISGAIDKVKNKLGGMSDGNNT